MLKMKILIIVQLFLIQLFLIALERSLLQLEVEPPHNTPTPKQVSEGSHWGEKKLRARTKRPI